MFNNNVSSKDLIRRVAKWALIIDAVWAAVAATFIALVANAFVVGAAGANTPDYWISVSAWLFAFIVAFFQGGIVIGVISVIFLLIALSGRSTKS